MNRKFVDGVEPFRACWLWDVVLYKGDAIIDSGKLKDVADRRGVQKLTIRYYLTPAGHRRADRRKGSGMWAIRL